jgi:predicted amino acid racemase
MKALPRIEIDLAKVEHNARTIADICARSGIQVAGVTKVTCGDPRVARAMLDGGVGILADSRIENIRRMKQARLDSEMLLLRSPQPSMARSVVRWAELSLNSELETVRELGKEASRLNREHGVILMVDLGDRREGVMPEEIDQLARGVAKVRGVRLEGIGTNLACFGGVIPTREKMERLVRIARELEDQLGSDLRTVSGGNSANIPLQLDGGHPPGVNQLRIGEGIMLGLETVGRTPIPGTHQDAFKVVGELVEVRRKPSVPDGEVGQDAFGHTPEIVNRGTITEGILALGRQDVDPDGLEPTSRRVDVLGASSDHLILDMGNGTPSVGETASFLPSYSSLLRAMTSSYVEKVYV